MKRERGIHTRGADESRSSFGNILIVDDISLLEISIKEQRTVATNAITLVKKAIVEKSPNKNPLFNCGNCEYNQSDLAKHKDAKH